jgi:predicted ATPase
MGYPEQVQKKTEEGFLLAQGSGHPYSTIWALITCAMTHCTFREFPQTQKWAEEAIALSSALGCEQELGWSTMLRGWSLAQQGNSEEGIAQIQEGLMRFRSTGARLDQPYFLGLLADAYAQAGQMEKSLATVDEALEWVERTGERMEEASLYYLKGKFLLQSDIDDLVPRESQAEEYFHKAIVIARRQSAKLFELWAIKDLARLWQRQGKKAEAHKLLSEIYNWFTEGFDTKDLQEAKALIESLSH